MNYPNDLKYSKSHEWIKTEDGLTLVGISDFAQDALGDVVILYIPALVLATISIGRKRMLSAAFIRRERKRAFVVFGVSFLSLAGAYVQDPGYELKSD